MRLIVIAVGRLKQGPERELAAAYRKRAEAIGRGLGIRDIEIVEIRESRAQDAERRRTEESIAIANVIPDRAVVAILDQRGSNLDSAALAGLLREWRAEDRPAACFVIGSADGLAQTLTREHQVQARLRRGDLAASIGARHAAGADLPRRHDLGRTSLSSRLTRKRPNAASPNCDEIRRRSS